MKNYQKAQMIAKNLPTGSYAAGCPTGTRLAWGYTKSPDGHHGDCSQCEIAN